MLYLGKEMSKPREKRIRVEAVGRSPGAGACLVCLERARRAVRLEWTECQRLEEKGAIVWVR